MWRLVPPSHDELPVKTLNVVVAGTVRSILTKHSKFMSSMMKCSTNMCYILHTHVILPKYLNVFDQSEMLKAASLCPKCKYPSHYRLQAHMVVAHDGKHGVQMCSHLEPWMVLQSCQVVCAISQPLIRVHLE